MTATIGFDLSAAEVPALYSVLAIPTPNDGRLSAPGTLLVTVNDWGTTTVNLGSTSSNNTVDDLITQLNAALTGSLNGRQQEPNEHADDANHHEEFGKGEARPPTEGEDVAAG